jgi:hypothetical protein
MSFTDQVIFCQECFRTIDGKVDTLHYLSAALNIPGYHALRIRQLVSVLQEISASSARYRIIGGDLNAEENSTEIHLLKERGPVIDSASHWVDHLLIIRPEEEPYPQFTCSETVLDQPDTENGLYPSDHFGVHARLLAPD